MVKVLTKRRLGLFVLFLLITAGLTMPATAAKKTRVPTEQVPGLLIGQWKGTLGPWIPEISLDITSVQGGRIRGVGHEFGSKCTGPYEVTGEITKKGKIIYTRPATESCSEYVFKFKMFRTKAGELIMKVAGYPGGIFRVSPTPGVVRQPSKVAPSSPAARESAPTVTTAGLKSVTLPAGTMLTVELTENLHSAFNSFGEIVLMKAAEDIRVDGQTVISKGASVTVEISNIIKSPGAPLFGKNELKLSAVSVEAVDGQWVELDRDHFSGRASGPTAASFYGAVFVKDYGIYVLRGARYAVIISRDTGINTAATQAPPSLKKVDLYTKAAFKDTRGVIKFHKLSKRKPGKNFILKIVLTADMAAIVQDEPGAVAVVKILDDILLKPINPFFVKRDLKRSILIAAFDWWQLIKHIRPGETPMTVQLVLADGRLAQAEAILKTEWKLK